MAASEILTGMLKSQLLNPHYLLMTIMVPIDV
ncbi:hypothetical protein MWMV2_MWMV2_03693 [Acinetobacter oleivorans]|nr:hypothetical protein MWMV3_MWMV3_03691 [Acinetobacter oleivorans]CAI3119465.1 hypothetical protein MWMV12_MWMV12_03653 [Acinetobacter oleivorans]CAI3119543.1 hypothetical protein MWMV19_MWMV19_03655 [Acinetobacter oleivorans]CAI3120193.1 hypothetical protein MWMV5_MWMV5_03694 [Acinetobacter oleivorans]CAI3120201.1 hypothetical protein MWMV13_MWMV13_03695 [Acinetobacter oleivorans]